MPALQNNYELLLDKLRSFKRKYYLNEILRGFIYFIAILLISYLIAAFLEYLGRLDPLPRTILFWSFIAVNVWVIIRFIALPIFSLVELRQGISTEQAANIIGRHFSDVKDKLLNTLQLHQQATVSTDLGARSLIEASINQKAVQLKPIPFINAIDLSGNKRYLKWVLPPVAIIILLLIVAPKILRDSTTRLVAYNKTFEKEAPFKFELLNKELKAMRGEDFAIKLSVAGEQLPAEVFIIVDGNKVKMNAEGKSSFNYTLRSLSKREYQIEFTANGFTTKKYLLKVNPKAGLEKFEVSVKYPSYLGKKDEVLSNAGDMTLPQGTIVKWQFYPVDAETLSLILGAENKEVTKNEVGEYVWQSKVMQDQDYTVLTQNRYMSKPDSISYQITVIPDAAPSITATEERDPNIKQAALFNGDIHDDHGFSRLHFVYKFTKRSDSASRKSPNSGSINLPLAPGRLDQSFVYYWDMTNVKVSPGDELEYYIEVYDNDGVNGAKSARTQSFYYKTPSLNEIEKDNAKNMAELQKDMESAMKEAQQLQKELEKERRSLTNKPNLDFQDKKRLQTLLNRQKELQEKMKKLNEQYEKNLKDRNEFTPLEKELQEKNDRLLELMKQMNDPEMEKMAQELQKQLDKDDKEGLQKQLSEMQEKDKELQKDLERMQEMYKQLEFEQNLNQNIEKLDKLKEDQEKLAEKTEKSPANDAQKQEQLKEEQKKIDKEFDEVKKDIEKLEKINDELENKNEMEDTKPEQEDIDDAMEKSEEDLEKKENSKAAKNQKDAGKNMQKMKEKLEKMKMEADSDAKMEDYNTLREILDNLIYVSKEQERLMSKIADVNEYNSEFLELSKRQRQLKDDATLIEDSLLALSKRVPEISGFVNKEIAEINFNMNQALDALSKRNLGEGQKYQQFAMTSLNNLALMLSESLENMQESMKMDADSKPGKKPSKKKGKKPGKMSMKQLREQQQQLQKDLQGMKKDQEGQQKDGQNGKDGQSKKLAEMAARQEALRRRLQELNEQRNKDGLTPSKEIQEIQKMMEEQEKDIVNNRISDRTLKRQKEIETRMLVSEKAERMQDQDEQRKAEQGKDKKNLNPPLFKKYIRLKEQEDEMLRMTPPAYNSYYRQKVKAYFGAKK